MGVCDTRPIKRCVGARVMCEGTLWKKYGFLLHKIYITISTYEKAYRERLCRQRHVENSTKCQVRENKVEGKVNVSMSSVWMWRINVWNYTVNTSNNRFALIKYCGDYPQLWIFQFLWRRSDVPGTLLWGSIFMSTGKYIIVFLIRKL